MPGLSRKRYAIIVGAPLLFMVVIPQLIVNASRLQQPIRGPVNPLGMAEILLLLLILLPMTASRLRNLALSPFAAALLLAPLINIALLVLALSAPAAWGRHRTFDSSGRIIATIVISCMLLIVALNVLPGRL